jgi:hypothetical protein
MATLDLTGKKFGRLTVESVERTYNGKPIWTCRCHCGKTRACRAGDLTAGRAKACFVCASELRRRRLKRQAKSRARKLSDVAKLTAMLDASGLRLYERWEASCEKLAVKVTKDERVEVLRELVNGSAA